jgi:hypothetical protein
MAPEIWLGTDPAGLMPIVMATSSLIALLDFSLTFVCW